jgi:excisionase family DNA binding protein
MMSSTTQALHTLWASTRHPCSGSRRYPPPSSGQWKVARRAAMNRTSSTPRREVRLTDEGPSMKEPGSRSALAQALIDELDDDALRELAARLQPHLTAQPRQLLNAADAAAILGLHSDTLVRMARTRRIWAVKVGREWRFRADLLDVHASPTNASPPRSWPGRPAARSRPSVAAIRGVKPRCP